ncbi:MAG: radical SAM protein [Bdellovibrio sp.]
MARFNSSDDISKEFQRRNLPPNFCHVPFTTLILEPDGTVGSCRVKGTEFSVGNLRENTIQEIWNGPKLTEWRRQFLAGKPEFCEKEVRCDGCHLCPDYNSILPSTEAVEFQTQGPLRLGLNLNGRCNLECKMCHVWKMPNSLYDEMGMWPQIEGLIASVQEIEFFSGEPFIQKDTYRAIDLISQKNPDCLVTFTTNGHWKLNDHIKSHLDKIKIRNLIVSVDSLIPETYAKIRRKGTLQVVLDNIERLKEYDQDRIARGLGSLNLIISFTVQKDNWSELGAFRNYEIATGLEVFRSLVYEPLDCSLLSLSQAEREEILEFYIQNLNKDQWLRSHRIIRPLLDSLSGIGKAQKLLAVHEKMHCEL